MDGVVGKIEVGEEGSIIGEKVSTVTRISRSLDLVLRFVGMGFTLVAAVVSVLNKDTEVVAFTIVDTLPPLHVPVTAKWYYLSAFVYFVVANAIACFYAAVSLVTLSIMPTKKPPQKGVTLTLSILDLVMIVLLFSANGAAAAVGLIAYHGNSHVNWNKVCNVVESFCRQSIAAVVMSLIGSFVFLWLVLFRILNLHKKSRWNNT